MGETKVGSSTVLIMLNAAGVKLITEQASSPGNTYDPEKLGC